jgi:hypothetical protein
VSRRFCPSCEAKGCQETWPEWCRYGYITDCERAAAAKKAKEKKKKEKEKRKKTGDWSQKRDDAYSRPSRKLSSTDAASTSKKKGAEPPLRKIDLDAEDRWELGSFGGRSSSRSGRRTSLGNRSRNDGEDSG